MLKGVEAEMRAQLYRGTGTAGRYMCLFSQEWDENCSPIARLDGLDRLDAHADDALRLLGWRRREKWQETTWGWVATLRRLK